MDNNEIVIPVMTSAILDLLRESKSAEEIAAALGVTLNNVYSRMSDLKRLGLVRRAYKCVPKDVGYVVGRRSAEASRFMQYVAEGLISLEQAKAILARRTKGKE